jgi:predicted DNA-binding transcriptional regulator YafY
MPVNKNAMTRYKILDELLSSRYHNYSLDNLTEEVNKQLSELDPNTDGIVRRTIEKDIAYLEFEGPFLADIERYTVHAYNAEKKKTTIKKCLRYANPSFSIFKKEMNDDEAYLLRELLSLLGQFDGLPNFEALEGLRMGLGVKREQRPIISFTKNPLQGSNLLGELFTAISQRLVIELQYHTFAKKDTPMRVVVYPYLLKEYNHRWYLLSAAESDRAMLIFSLDRMEKITTLPSHKYVDYEGDINEYFEDIIGITFYKLSPVYTIVFWVSSVSCDYVLTKPLHESQRTLNKSREEELRKAYPTLQGGMFFQIDCKFNYELIRELTSYGPELIVLSPCEIQETIVECLQRMNEIYSGLKKQNISNP